MRLLRFGAGTRPLLRGAGFCYRLPGVTNQTNAPGGKAQNNFRPVAQRRKLQLYLPDLDVVQ